MARSAAKSTPIVESGILYSDDDATGTRLGTPEWSVWLETATIFYFRHAVGGFTARKEPQRNGWFWYAYKSIGGRTRKLYIGSRPLITTARLEEIARRFTEQ